MKMTTKVLIAIAAAVTLIPAAQATAQHQPGGQDGVAASPKLRQALEEHRAVAPSQNIHALASAPAARQYKIAASPRLQQQLTENKPRSGAVAGIEVASTTTRVDDGIAASPKVREQLRSTQPSFQIAPRK
jgi:hypothetical protein